MTLTYCPVGRFYSDNWAEDAILSTKHGGVPLTHTIEKNKAASKKQIKNHDLTQQGTLQPPISNRQNQGMEPSGSACAGTGLSHCADKIASLGIPLHSLGGSEQSQELWQRGNVSTCKCDITAENCLFACTWRQACCSR